MIGLAAPAIVVISHDSTASMTFVQQSLMVHSENIIAALVLGIAWLGARARNDPYQKRSRCCFPSIATGAAAVPCAGTAAAHHRPIRQRDRIRRVLDDSDD